jgi:DnaJ-domain-containing protein 1
MELCCYHGCGVAGFWLVCFLIDAFRAKTRAGHGTPRDPTNERSRTSDESRREPTWFEVLGVSPTASVDEIKNAYRERVRQYHPDRVQGLGKEFWEIAEQKTKELNSAYNYALRIR